MSTTTVKLKSLFTFLFTPSVAALFRVHPNDRVSGVSSVPEAWEWWKWASHDASSMKPARKILDHYYSTSLKDCGLPEPLVVLLDRIKSLQRPREPIPISVPPSVASFSVVGQSPKKQHEVIQMASYIDAVLEKHRDKVDLTQVKIVDVGAGQGYLTRALANLLATKYPTSDATATPRSEKRILAIDSNELQTTGAQRWEDAAVKGKRGQQAQARLVTDRLIEHRTIRLGSSELLHELDDWLPVQEDRKPIPVLFVALHACGSLTPNILRAIVASTHNDLEEHGWYPLGGVIVGCCYNLLDPQDFPLSAALTQEFLRDGGELARPALPSSAYHLAAQTPATYYLTPRSSEQFDLSVKKVVWRAQLSGFIRSSPESASQQIIETPIPGELGIVGTGQSPIVQRLGRLNDKVYTEWENFLGAAGEKMGASFVDEDGNPRVLRDLGLESQLEVLQVLRCLLGPVAETLFLEDRLMWLKEALEEEAWDVELVNLFDQATGSGRNVALVISTASAQ